jgi:four helix bundle protein
MKANPKAGGRWPKEGRRPGAEAPELGDGVTYWTHPISSVNGFVLKDEVNTPKGPPQALLERTALFGEAIVRFAKKIPSTAVNRRLIEQLVGAGTSVGANFCEADDAVSGKEYKQKIGICRKESKETMFFLRMMATAEPELAEESHRLWREARELNLIFGAIWRK